MENLLPPSLSLSNYNIMDGAECQFLNLQQSREKDRLREDRVHNGTCKKEEKRKSKKQKICTFVNDVRLEKR
jgi:hypothetical protein